MQDFRSRCFRLPVVASASGIVCDWKGQRDSFQNDEKPLLRAFAFVYVGSIVDQAISDPISDDLRKVVVSDMSSALDMRQTAVDWGAAKALTNTDPFAHAGYKLASRLLRTGQSLIESPSGVIDTIEGESLVNDATGLLMLSVGFQRFSNAQMSVGHDVTQFFWLLCGGITIGVVSAFIATRLAAAILQGPNAIALTLVAAYGSYFAADVVHASGIISVVACGLYMSRSSSVVLSPITRLQAGAVWETIEFALNGLAFILTGLQLPAIWHAARSMNFHQAVIGSFVLTGVPIFLRMIWMYPSSYFSYWICSRLLRQVCEAPDGKTIFLMGWPGMRGVVALAAAGSLPILRPGNTTFTQRPVMILLTFCVIVLTLVLQGLSLGPFIRRLNLSGTDHFACEAGEARRPVLQKAISTLQEHREQVDPSRDHDYEAALHQYEHLFESVLDCSIAEHKTLERGLFRHGVMLAVVQAERAELISLRSLGRIGDPVSRTIERELDLQESRLLSMM